MVLFNEKSNFGGVIFYFTDARHAILFGEESVFPAVQSRRNRIEPRPFSHRRRRMLWPLIKGLPSKNHQRHSESFQHSGELVFFTPITGQLHLSSDFAAVHIWTALSAPKVGVCFKIREIQPTPRFKSFVNTCFVQSVFSPQPLLFTFLSGDVCLF